MLHRWPSPFGAACGASLLMAFAASPISAQSLRGVIEAESGERIEGAVVTLMGAANLEVTSALSDALGQFELAAADPGGYRLRVYRIGFEESISEQIQLTAGEVKTVRVVLSVEAIVLEGLEVGVDSDVPIDSRLLRQGFYARQELYDQKMGFAEFLTRDEIERVIAFKVSDVLRQANGLRLRHVGGRDVRIGVRSNSSCPGLSFYLDGMRIRVPGGEIDDFVSPTDLIAIEVYPSMVGPLQYGGGCAVVMWTGM